MINFDSESPLSQCIGEPKTANAGLVDYYNMGAGRTLRALWEIYRKNKLSNPEAKPPTTRLQTVFSWSNKFEWQQRVDLMLRIDRTREETEKALALREKMRTWVDRQEAIRERDYTQAEQLRDLADSVLAEGPKFTKTTRKFIKGTNGKPDREIITIGLDAKLMTTAVMAASKLQRLAAEMETDHTLEETITPEGIEKIRAKRWESIQDTLAELGGVLVLEGDQEDDIESSNQEEEES